MSEPRRVVRWAQIEYQPNLEHPTKPIPLGIVVEEKHGGRRKVILLGRSFTGSERALQLEDSWGPFREIVTNWFEVFSKSIAELMNKTARTAFVGDDLAQQWHSNVYVKEPENKTAALSLSLERVARDCYKAFTGEDVPPLPGERPPARRVAHPRMNYMVQATV